MLPVRCTSRSDAPAEQHVELHSAPAANLTQPRHIEGLRERHHRHWRFHPQLKCYRPISLLGIDFLFHLTTSKISGTGTYLVRRLLTALHQSGNGTVE